MKFANLSILSAAVMPTMLSASLAQAAYVISTPGTPVTETFTNYAGTAAPANFTVVAAPSPTSFRGQNDGASNSNGVYAYGTGTDFSLGFLASGSATLTATAAAGFTNSTGTTLNNFAVNYSGEQWRNGGRPSSFAVAYSINGGAFIDVAALAYVAPNTTGGSSGTQGSGTGTLKTALLTGLTVTPGSTFNLRWTYTGNGDGSSTGARSGLSIDTLSVTGTAVPEPTSLALLGLGTIAALRRRRA